MLECRKKKEKMPVVEEIQDKDESWAKDLKQLLLRMTKYRPEDRENVQNVDKELESNSSFLLLVFYSHHCNISNIQYYTMNNSSHLQLTISHITIVHCLFKLFQIYKASSQVRRAFLETMEWARASAK